MRQDVTPAPARQEPVKAPAKPRRQHRNDLARWALFIRTKYGAELEDDELRFLRGEAMDFRSFNHHLNRKKRLSDWKAQF